MPLETSQSDAVVPLETSEPDEVVALDDDSKKPCGTHEVKHDFKTYEACIMFTVSCACHKLWCNPAIES